MNKLHKLHPIYSHDFASIHQHTRNQHQNNPSHIYTGLISHHSPCYRAQHRHHGANKLRHRHHHYCSLRRPRRCLIRHMENRPRCPKRSQRNLGREQQQRVDTGYSRLTLATTRETRPMPTVGEKSIYPGALLKKVLAKDCLTMLRATLSLQERCYLLSILSFITLCSRLYGLNSWKYEAYVGWVMM